MSRALQQLQEDQPRSTCLPDAQQELGPCARSTSTLRGTSRCATLLAFRWKGGGTSLPGRGRGLLLLAWTSHAGPAATTFLPQYQPAAPLPSTSTHLGEPAKPQPPATSL